MKYSIYAALVASVSADCSTCTGATPICATPYVSGTGMVPTGDPVQCVAAVTDDPCGTDDATTVWRCEDGSAPFGGADG